MTLSEEVVIKCHFQRWLRLGRAERVLNNFFLTAYQQDSDIQSPVKPFKWFLKILASHIFHHFLLSVFMEKIHLFRVQGFHPGWMKCHYYKTIPGLVLCMSGLFVSYSLYYNRHVVDSLLYTVYKSIVGRIFSHFEDVKTEVCNKNVPCWRPNIKTMVWYGSFEPISIWLESRESEGWSLKTCPHT